MQTTQLIRMQKHMRDLVPVLTRTSRCQKSTLVPSQGLADGGRRDGPGLPDFRGRRGSGDGEVEA